MFVVCKTEKVKKERGRGVKRGDHWRLGVLGCE